MNPKQASTRPDESGNFLKLPLGTKNGKESKVYQDGKAVRKITNLEIQYLDITGYRAYVDEKQKVSKKLRNSVPQANYNKVNVGACQARDCLLQASKMNLEGDVGNSIRVFIAREFLSAGMQPAEITVFFEQQLDYDRTKTLYYIGQVMKKSLPPVPCSTIYEKVGDFIGCKNCKERALVRQTC